MGRNGRVDYTAQRTRLVALLTDQYPPAQILWLISVVANVNKLGSLVHYDNMDIGACGGGRRCRLR
jgi:hypothetical protein